MAIRFVRIAPGHYQAGTRFLLSRLANPHRLDTKKWSLYDNGLLVGNFKDIQEAEAEATVRALAETPPAPRPLTYR